MEIITRLIKELGLDRNIVEYAIDYLKRYGYLSDNFDLADVEGAIRRFQEFFELNQDGIIGPKTLRAMQSLRCGCPDTIQEARLAKWNKNRITYSIHNFVDGLSREVQEQLHIKAWESIEAVCDLTIVYVGVGKRADINVRASNRGNGLGAPNGTLAYAYLPYGNDAPLDMVLDLAEMWTDSPNRRGILLHHVAAHEYCHNLGVSHHSVPNSLMNPFYSPSIGTPQREDIRQLQMRYGEPKAKPAPPPEPKPDPEPNRTTITIVGSVSDISIPGYRVTKI